MLNKFGYLNNKRWSSDSRARNFATRVGLDLNTQTHEPCGHWHKRNITIAETCYSDDIFAFDTPCEYPSFICTDGDYLYFLARDAVLPFPVVYTYTFTGTFVSSFQVLINPSSDDGMAVSDAHIYITGPAYIGATVDYAHVAKYLKDGTFVTAWATHIGVNHYTPKGICYHDGAVYVSTGGCLFKFDTAGNTLWTNLNYGGAVGQFGTANSMIVVNNILYMADYTYSRVVMFDIVSGAVIGQSSYMVPASPNGIANIGNRIYIPPSTAVYIFDMNVTYICHAAWIDTIFYIPGSGMFGNLVSYGGYLYATYRNGAIGNEGIVKFKPYQTGDPIGYDNYPDEPQIWPM